MPSRASMGGGCQERERVILATHERHSRGFRERERRGRQERKDAHEAQSNKKNEE